MLTIQEESIRDEARGQRTTLSSPRTVKEIMESRARYRNCRYEDLCIAVNRVLVESDDNQGQINLHSALPKEILTRLSEEYGEGFKIETPPNDLWVVLVTMADSSPLGEGFERVTFDNLTGRRIRAEEASRLAEEGDDADGATRQAVG